MQPRMQTLVDEIAEKLTEVEQLEHRIHKLRSELKELSQELITEHEVNTRALDDGGECLKHLYKQGFMSMSLLD